VSAVILLSLLGHPWKKVRVAIVFSCFVPNTTQDKEIRKPPLENQNL
jgi:hypothetical protein